MRLAGERVTLVPVPPAVATAVVAGSGLQAELDALGLTAARGWPHADTADAVRPVAQPAAFVGEPGGSFLILLGGEVVGECGWLGGPDENGVAEIGYGLAGSVRGRGLGTEAVGVLAAWAERQPAVRRLTADVLVGNEPSRRLLIRLGFAEQGGTPPYVSYVRDAPHMDAVRE